MTASLLMTRPLAAILTVGDELLRGDVIDSNKAHIAAVLGDHGFEVVQARSVLDREAAIVAAVQELQTQVDCIMVSGGLGPTVDDLTARALAVAFGRKVQRFAEAEAHLEEIFARYGRPMAACNLQQADLPEGTEILANPHGSAVGIGLQWSRAGKEPGILMSLPGVPFEMKAMLANEVLPRCKTHFEALRGAPEGGSLRRTYRTMGKGESDLAQALGDRLEGESWRLKVQERLGFAIAAPIQHYRSHSPEVLVGLEFPGLTQWPEGLVPLLDELVAEPMGASLYAVDQPELVGQVAKVLTEQGLSLAVAESCTAGALGECLTQQSGASSFFWGGVLVYSNEMKERLLGISPSLLAEHGAVSKCCAQAMAMGVRERTGASLGVGITGIAGPTGGSAEKPVGTVFVSVASAQKVHTAHFRLRGDRLGVRRRASQWACRMVADLALGRETWLGTHGSAFEQEDLPGSIPSPSA